MIVTIFPKTWTPSEREVYERWSASEAVLTDKETTILCGCFERIRKGEKPECVVVDDPHVADEQHTLDPYHPNNWSMT